MSERPGRAAAAPLPAVGNPGTTLHELLELERLDDDMFRTIVVSPEPGGLFGGQVAAQALKAAAGTVPQGRQPHSLHGYFLTRGDSSRRVLLRVSRDRDGGSYSNRRVVAVQDGKVIFNMAASFHRAEDGPSYQAAAMPDVEAPGGLPDHDRRIPLPGVQTRLPSQPLPGQDWPSRAWMRALHPLEGETEHACALTFVSDMFVGHSAVDGLAMRRPLTSLDHALWFYRPPRMDDWVLMDLQPETGAGGRATYTGRIFSADGTLVAGLAQETLLRA